LASNILPKSPATFNTWFASFHKNFTANYKKHGFTAADVRHFNNVYKAWQQSYASFNSFNQFVDSWSKVNAQQFASFQAFVASYWNAFQSISSTSTKTTTKAKAKKSSPRSSKPAIRKSTKTASKTAAKKTAAKKPSVKRTIAKKAVKATTPKKAASKTTVRKSPKTAAKSNSFAAPFVWLTNGKKAGQINVYVGASKNGGFHLPQGAKSAFVQYRTTGRAWRTLIQGSSFPFTHNFSGRKVWYRACWIGTNGKNSAWSKGVTYTVGANKKAA
jgi:hypothetical protein